MAEDEKSDYSKRLTSVHQPIYNVAMMLMNSIPTLGPAIAWGVSGVFPDPGQAARDQFIIGLAEKIDWILEQDQIEQALKREPAPALLSHAMNIASRSFGQEKTRSPTQRNGEWRFSFAQKCQPDSASVRNAGSSDGRPHFNVEGDWEARKLGRKLRSLGSGTNDWRPCAALA